MEGKHKALFSACRHGDVLADFIGSALFLFSVSLGRLNCYFFFAVRILFFPLQLLILLVPLQFCGNCLTFWICLLLFLI